MSSSHPAFGPPAQPSSIAEALKLEGIEHFGVATLATPISISFYEEWLARDFHGEMSYLVSHLETKREPKRLLPRAQSAIVVALPYVPHPAPLTEWPLKSQSLQVARYAQGRDYHHFLKGKMDRIAALLREQFPHEIFLTFTDSGPVLERDLARRAGLGWVGKNTCLIDRRVGSLFFISEIFTTLRLDTLEQSLPISTSALAPDHCGTCTRCMDACPTGAIVAPRELDARKCISYLTIESKAIPEKKAREEIGDWFFGCDICQTVCPWNLKAHGNEALTRTNYREDLEERNRLIEDLRFLLASPFRHLEREFAKTPLIRAGGVGLKRNALINCANMGVIELIPVVNALTSHTRLGELASWTLKILLEKQTL